MTRVLASLLLLSLSQVAVCCPVLSEPEEILVAEAKRAEATTLVQGIWDESDTVMLARIEFVEEKEENSFEPTGGGKEGWGVMRRLVYGDVLATPLKVLKGEADESVRLKYERNESHFEISCVGITGFRTVDVQRTFRYLLYVREGEILRANPLVDWFERLDVDTEIELLGDEWSGR